MGEIRQAIELGTSEDLAARLASDSTEPAPGLQSLAPVTFDPHDQVRS
jgi:hypothetical protein